MSKINNGKPPVIHYRDTNDSDTDDEMAAINEGFSSIAIDRKVDSLDLDRRKKGGSEISGNKLILRNSSGTSFSGAKRKKGLPNSNLDFGTPPDDKMDDTPASVASLNKISTSPLVDNQDNKRRK